MKMTYLARSLLSILELQITLLTGAPNGLFR